MKKPEVTLVVYVEGGIVQDVMTLDGQKSPVSVLVLDEDEDSNDRYITHLYNPQDIGDATENLIPAAVKILKKRVSQEAIPEATIDILKKKSIIL